MKCWKSKFNTKTILKFDNYEKFDFLHKVNDINNKKSFNLQPTDPDLVVEKNVYMYRAYLALKKFGVVRDEVGNNSPALLQPLKTLMAYIQSEGNASKRYFHILCLENSIKFSFSAKFVSFQLTVQDFFFPACSLA